MRRGKIVGLLVLVMAVLASCGGGSDSDDAATDTTSADATADVDDVSNGADDESAARDADDDTLPSVVPVATTPPEPTATPLPTSTPEPLEAPTPSSVLLTTAFTNSSKVTTVGIDEVFFGMTAEEAAEAASTTWVELPSTSGTCYRITPENGPEEVQLWVVDGFVERVDIGHPDLRTPSQLGLGNTAAELRSQLGDRLTIEASGDGGQVATFTPTDEGDREFRIVFELEDDAVVSYRSGRATVVDRAPESC